MKLILTPLKYIKIKLKVVVMLIIVLNIIYSIFLLDQLKTKKYYIIINKFIINVIGKSSMMNWESWI